MKIAVFGYYNNLNEGDDYLQYCLTRLCKQGGHEVVFLPHNRKPPSSNYLSRFDWIVIGGGGLVFSHRGIWSGMNKWIKKTKCKVGVVGLGVNSLSSSLKKEINDLISFSSFFYVRDAKSKALLSDIPRGESSKVETAPDLSWMYPLPRKIPDVSTGDGIALNLTEGAYTGKAYDPGQWVEALRKLDEKIHPFPLRMTSKHDKGVLERNLDCSIHHRFSIQPLHNAKALVGARFHSIMFATMLRIPFVAIAYDTKVERLCDEIGLGNLCLYPDQPDLLDRKLRYVYSNYDEIVETLNVYCKTQVEEANKMKETILVHLKNKKNVNKYKKVMQWGKQVILRALPWKR